MYCELEGKSVKFSFVMYKPNVVNQGTKRIMALQHKRRTFVCDV